MAPARPVAPVVKARRLLERDATLAAVLDSATDVAPGHGRTWLVCAEGGGGKTVFLHAIVAGLAGARVYWGNAEPLTPPVPYLAIARAIPAFVARGSQAANIERAVDQLREAATGTLLVVILDDLQFADDGTIAVARRLAVEARSSGWLVLLSFRSAEGVAALADLASDLVGNGRAERVDLAPLSVGGVAELARHIRGTDLSDAELTQLAHDSGGNPWFVEALASGDARLTAARQHLQVQLARIARALPGADAVLRAFAVVTRPVSFDVVAAICGGDSAVLRETLHKLRDAAMLTELNDSWQLRQELMRQAILNSLIPADRRDAHRRLAEALEREGRAAELAMHYEAADDLRAGKWALIAAQEAITMEAHGEAYLQLQRALAGELDASAQLLAYELATVEASAMFLVDEPIAFAQRGLALAATDSPGALRLSALLAMSLHWRGEVQRAQPYWMHRMQGAQASDAALLHGCHALCLAVSEQPLAAAEAAATCMALARPEKVSDPRDTDSLAHRGWDLAAVAAALAAMGGGTPGATAAANSALEKVRVHGLVPWSMCLAALTATALVALELDAADEAIALLAATLERRQVGLRLSNAAFRRFAAVQRADFAPLNLPLPSDMPIPPHSGVASRMLAAHALRELRGGSLTAAAALLGAEPIPGQRALEGASLDLVRLEYLWLTNTVDAQHFASRMFSQACAQRHARMAGETAVYLARLGIVAPQPDWLDGGSRLQLFWQWSLGILREDPDALRAVSVALAAMGCHYEAAFALVDAGDLNAAYLQLRTMKATNLRDYVAARMRAARIRLPRRAQSAVAADGLTDTEREVCRLLLLELSNRELADRLNISVRTIETHLSNLYRKTDTNSRRLLARWWQARQQDRD